MKFLLGTSPADTFDSSAAITVEHAGEGVAEVSVNDNFSEELKYVDTRAEKTLLGQIAAAVDWVSTREHELLTEDGRRIMSFRPDLVDDGDTAEYVLWTCIALVVPSP